MNRDISKLILYLASFSSLLFAGNTSGGGGGVYEDGVNPWFLENTPAVKYCIEVDTAQFHLPVIKIQEIVKNAIETWKAALDKAANSTYSKGELEPYGQVRLGTQDFVQETCSPTTPLRFQFGALSESQKKDFLPNPKQVIAEAVRTAYDQVNLRGQGFIYVSPDSGTLRPDSPEMAINPWAFQDGIILKRVLLHELGHVFGLGHSGGPFDLMGAEHPENIVQASTIENLKKNSPEEIQTFLNRIGIFGFEYPYEKEICDASGSISLGIENVFDLFFGIPEYAQCRKLVLAEDSIEVYASPNKGGKYILIGRATPNAAAASTLSVTRTVMPAMRVKLTKEQKVFQKIPNAAKRTGYLDGPGVIRRKIFRASYESADGKKKGFMKTTYLPNQLIEMEVVWKNQIIELFDHGG